MNNMKKENNKKLNSFKKIVLQILIHFTIIFSMLAIISTISGAIVGSNTTGGFFGLTLILLVSLILSIVFYFIFKINKISLFLQITIVYILLAFVTYFINFYTIPGLFNFSSSENVMFFLSSIAITLIGYGIIAMIILLKTKRENDNLNKSLENFKERDK